MRSAPLIHPHEASVDSGDAASIAATATSAFGSAPRGNGVDSVCGDLPSGPAEHPRTAQPPFASQQSEWWLALLVVMDHEPQCAHEARTGRHVELPEVDLSITDVIGGSRRRTLQVGLAAQAHRVTHDPRAASMRSSLSPPHLNCLRKRETFTAPGHREKAPFG